jgi:putative ABC transport system permease protein
VKHFGPEVAQLPRLYVPFRQKPWPHMGFAIKTSGGTDALVSALRKELQLTDQDQAAFGIQTLAARFEERMAQDRWNTLLTTLIAVIALVFTAVGTYGVMAHFVTRRRQEIGLRMALGAHPRRVVLMVLRDAMLLTAPGIAIGLAAAWASSRLMTGLLFDVKPNDPLVFAGGAILLVIVGLIASSVPAWRAARVDPAEVLRLG